MKVAAIQFKPEKGKWEASADRLASLVNRAADAGAWLIVCPELALTGYVFANSRAARKVAEAPQGRTLARLAPLCRERGVCVVIGYVEACGKSLFNSALVIGPDGELIYNYRKRLLYELDEQWADPGELPYPLIHTPIGTVMVGICMDLNDWYFHAVLRHAQPDVIAFPTNWIHQGRDIRYYWRRRLRGVNGMLVAANTYGEEDGVTFLGRSAIMDRGPRRRTLAMAGETGDAVVIADVRLPVEEIVDSE